MTRSNSQRAGGSGGTDKHGGGERGDLSWDLFFPLLFFSACLTQVSADMLGACPGVDYNFKTTTGKAERAKASESKREGDETRRILLNKSSILASP